MSLEHRVRQNARSLLPASLRRPLGILCGSLRSRLLYPVLGLMFDVSGRRFRTEGCTFVIPRNITSLALRASFVLGDYEADERRLVREYFLPEDSVLELGACLGIVACVTNQRLRNRTRHVVVEANPHCLSALHRNRERNGAAFLVEHCAVTSQREVTFRINSGHITGSGLCQPAGDAIRVPGRSLAELLDRHGPFSVLIMDIEGSELEVLESSAAMLGTFRLILLELHETIIGAAGVDRCRAILAVAGFQWQTASHITEVWVNPNFAPRSAG